MAECLRDVCRLCGGGGAAGIDRRHPHCKVKYQLLIFKALDVDVSKDEMGTHPPYLCHTCFKKLGEWWKVTKLRKTKTCNIKVVTFPSNEQQHLSSICNDLLVMVTRHESFVTWRGTDRLKIMQFGESGRPEVEVVVYDDMSLRVEVCGIDVTGRGSVDIPATGSIDSVSELLGKLKKHRVCIGNSDYTALVQSREGPSGQIPLAITAGAVYQIYPYPTIRHKKCLLLISAPESRCQVCQVFRVDLNVLSSRLSVSTNPITTSSTVRNDTLSFTQLQNKVKLMKAENKALKRRNSSLRSKICALIEEDGVPVTNQEDSFLRQAMEEGETDFKTASHVYDGSPAALLWEQQKKALEKGKGMRWHPAIIRFCIALQSKSSSSYNLLRESGFLKLPHPNTLHPYTHFGNPAPGFNSDLVLRVLKDTKIDTLPEHQRNVSILFDEMKIKASLVYSVRSGTVVGFVDVGSIGNEILQFEKRCREGDVPVASHVLVLMVRGIFTGLRSPIGYYPSLGVSSHQLYPCMWEAIVLLEVAGFKVRALVSDGASPNRKFYRMHGPRNTLVYSTAHPASPSCIYFFCDAPHLMKTTRNNFENSGCNNKTRNLHYQKQDIKWNHLLTLYDWDTGLSRSSTGLRRLHKITYEHMHLSPALRMRVYMATQVLSSTVVNALRALGRHDTKSTELFVSNFDQFFDCLNVSNPHESHHKRKAALAPYKSVDDWRFKWLKEDFLGFLYSWEMETESLQNVTKENKQKMRLSRETVEGLRITVNSFVELAKLLLQNPEVEYLLSERFNQDPLEMYFSKQRSAGGSSDNPTAEQFGHNMMAFHVSSAATKASKRANVQKDREENLPSAIDATPLPKRPKQK